MVLFWIGVGIFFLIVEIITATFYGFSLAIASFIVTIYVAITQATGIDIIQGGIFAVVGLIASFLIFKFSRSIDTTVKPQGLDIYIGETRRVHRVDEDFKITLDGVEYIVVSDDDLESSDLVEIVDRRGSVFVGEKI